RAAGAGRGQKLAVRHVPARGRLCGGGLLARGRYRVREPPDVRLATRSRPRLRAARSAVRGQGVLLLARPLSSALRRQWSRGRRGLHRRAPAIARAVVLGPGRGRRRARVFRESTPAQLAAADGGVRDPRRGFVAPRRARSGVVPTYLREAERAAAG